ncbi:Ff.00g124240.m01.CDS01 [Fusarium sp. VM40]|nr:Ff.00g124240.m01.CDS01 [Fusarium sp. VM40]
MAPVQWQAAASPANHLSIRHYSHCSGWYCFTPAEQAGIIISVITVTMVALFVWMYVFGRITMNEKRKAPRQGGRLQNHSSTQNVPIPLFQLPQVPSFPSSRVTYLPIPYTRPGILAAQVPTQGHPFIIPQQPICMMIPVEPMAYGYPQPTYHSSTHHGSHPNDSTLYYASAQASVSSSYNLTPRQPTWVQRVCRAFGLPIGRASTVDTESVLETETSLETRSEISQRNSQLSRLEPSAQGGRGTAHDDQKHHRNRDLPSISSGSNDTQPEDINRIQSPVSIAATVHSDDYDTISHSNAASGDLRQNVSESHIGGNSTATDSTAVSESHASLVSSSRLSASSPTKRLCTSTPDAITGHQCTSHQQHSASMIRHGNSVSSIYPGIKQCNARDREVKRSALDYTFGSLAERPESNAGPPAPQPTHQREH